MNSPTYEHLCAVCGVSVIGITCICPDGPKIWKLPIPYEWEDYFFMDGSVKPVLINLNSQNHDDGKDVL